MNCSGRDGVRMSSAIVVPNSQAEILRRKTAGTLTWGGPARMLFARSGCAVLTQALVAGIYVLQSSPTPWQAAALVSSLPS